jgi:anti-anti-sigma factor
MKRDRISSRMQWHVGDEPMMGPGRANGPEAAAALRRGESHLTLAPERPWSHTLILRGDLDHHSAGELEDELVCLLEEGVTALTLDLRQLEAVDPRGAHVIALQSALFKGRGRRFGVLVGSPAVHSTLAATGGPDLLRSEPTEGLSRRFSIPPSHGDGADLSTTVTRDLGVGLTLQS